MGRLSRGCLRCRQRRVRCDEGRPSCQRCIHRNEVCEGYRDESTLVFRHETAKVVEHSRAIAQTTTPSPSMHSPSPHATPLRVRSRSVGGSSVSRRSLSLTEEQPGANLLGVLTTPEAAPIGSKLSSHGHPWLKQAPAAQSPSQMEESQAVNEFLDRYVMYPCNQTSSPGFLEHLPSMFKEVSIEGRYALRSAVLAASLAGALQDPENDTHVARQALQHYGRALNALGDSLATPGKIPDDYDLMTVVVLDIFETLYIPDQVKRGSHVHGMAQILRLQGPDLMYSPRGWSLFRLAHHRIQKQQLAFKVSQFTETNDWLDQLNESEPYVRLEKTASDIGETCKRARTLLTIINSNSGEVPMATLVDTIRELHSLDREAVGWRQRSQWAFTTVSVSQGNRPDLLPAAGDITDTIQLFSDVWIAYEWNYHRTARILFLQQLLACCRAALESPDLESGGQQQQQQGGGGGGEEEQTLRDTMSESISTIRWLADEYFAAVPQSFGDVNHMGRAHNDDDDDDDNGPPPPCRAIGAYLLLWPTRVVQSVDSATSHEQKERAAKVFERIREYTGMKDLLGAKSIVR